ncbi:hypothetical protein [Streptomyces recifensis]|uniref:hypothetical protein n=1 Tax=Streptomyces recifensis TaxID=67355 RepID=UPI000A3A3F37|nr:hypothetical protein [Streptomyces recifensis]
MPAPRSAPGPDTAREVIGWAVFACVLVPVVLLWCGTAPVTAVGAGLGLAGVTLACRTLLRRSLREAARGVTDHTGASTPVD